MKLDTKKASITNASQGTGITHAVARALASHQCVPGSISGPGVICRLSLLFVLYPSPNGFSLGTSVFSSPQTPKFPIYRGLVTPWCSVGKRITYFSLFFTIKHKIEGRHHQRNNQIQNKDNTHHERNNQTKNRKARITDVAIKHKTKKARITNVTIKLKKKKRKSGIKQSNTKQRERVSLTQQ